MSSIYHTPVHQKPVHNRIQAVMSHITRYAFKGGTRLAADAGVSKSAVCRLLNGQSSPSYTLLHLILRALERHLGKSLDPRELISLDGTYPTASVCQLAGCSGCLPAEAYDAEGNLKAEFKHFKPGHWSLSRSTSSAHSSPHTTIPPEATSQKTRQKTRRKTSSDTKHRTHINHKTESVLTQQGAR